jgi:inner membrane protein
MTDQSTRDKPEESPERTKTKFGSLHRLWTKLVGMFVVIVVLLIALGLIKDQISSREHYQTQVTTEIANSAAAGQTVVGPILAIHYKTSGINPETGTPDRIHEYVVYVPARKLNIRGHSSVERRYRGIYQARLFHLDADVEGSFEVDANVLDIPNGHSFVAGSAALLFGITDLRGLDADPEVLVDGKPLHFMTPTDKRFENIIAGNRLEIELGAWQFGQARNIAFSFPLKLTGTEALSIAPTAGNNVIQLDSDWKHPSFAGRFLPRKRAIDEKGFSAEWEISQLARNLENALKDRGEVLSIGFMDPVNVYLQAERAVKYGILFVVLTFAAFFVNEILRRRPMHLMQYLLVGLALAIFFLLLVALSEQLSFALAYLVSAVACVGLIVGYLAGVFASWRLAWGFGAGLASLYGMLFAILQLEDRALLMGSLLLFAALAATMLSTRRIDWNRPMQDVKTDFA